MTFALSLRKDEATNYFSPYQRFHENAPQASSSQANIILRHFNFLRELSTGESITVYPSKYRHGLVIILRAKCIRSQALYFLISPILLNLTGKGWKRSYDKWSDDEEIYFLSGIWPTLVLNVSKQWQLILTSND